MHISFTHDESSLVGISNVFEVFGSVPAGRATRKTSQLTNIRNCMKRCPSNVNTWDL